MFKSTSNDFLCLSFFNTSQERNNFVVPHHHTQKKKIYVIIMQGDKQEELPEFLLGTCRLNQLDIAKAVPINPS